MYDMNFELLTMLYYYFKRHETYDRLDEFILNLSTLYKNEYFLGGIVNFYFTDEIKMKETLDIEQEEIEDVSNLFKRSVQLLENMKTLEIIPEEVKLLYGIEGLNHIENEDMLIKLYNMGLRSISNSYLNDQKELTPKDLILIKKAMELGMIININKTSYESLSRVINLINECEEYEPIIIFNEDNIDELKKLPNASYYILVVQNKSGENKEEKEKDFIKRIKEIKENKFFSNNKIILCKTNRDFSPKVEIPILSKDENNSNHLKKSIISEFGIEFANQIMKNNASLIFDKILIDKKERQKSILPNV